MKTIQYIIICICFFSSYHLTHAQEGNEKDQKIDILESKKEKVIAQEKEQLKKEVIEINKKLEKGQINEQEALNLKKKAADNHALNIKNKTAIIDNSIELIERGENDKIGEFSDEPYKVVLFDSEEDGTFIKIEHGNKPKKYDRRTYHNVLLSFGLNNAIIEGGSLNDSPYSIGRSKYFELGMTWSTRLLNNSNAIRLRYGFSFFFNELSPTDNQYFVQDGDWTYLQEHYGDLCKSKLKTDQLLFPIHFEFGPSRKYDKEDYIRYSSKRSFKIGFGAYGGFNLYTRQKLKYKFDGSYSKEKNKQSFNTNNVIYGLSSYIGYGSTSLYVKYDLNSMFKEPNVEQHNVAFGFRFDI